METMDNTPPPLSPESAAGYRALVVDDERPLAAVVASYLEREHFEVAVAYNGVDALTLAREIDPTSWSSTSGCRAWTESRCAANCGRSRTLCGDADRRSAEMDTIIGLSVGADDYVTKPFSHGSWWHASAPCCADRGRRRCTRYRHPSLGPRLRHGSSGR